MNMLPGNIHPIFSTPILTNNIRRPLATEEMLACKNGDYYNDNASSAETPTHIAYTKSNNVLENPALTDIKKFIFDNINQYLFDLLKINDRINFYVSRSWFVESNKGDFSRRHSHPNSVLSGVFYFKAPANCGNLILYDNRASLFGSLHFSYGESSPANSTLISIPPAEGNLILFPSNMMHEVGINLSNETRYSLSFDVWFTGQIGHSTSMTILSV
jgi:uncharacterized protein (TIGR02466 family)